jgi:predicted nucleotidyltransferase
VLCEQLPNLRRRYGVVSLGLFGSYVRGKQREASDLDVLVQFDERPLSLLDLINLEHHLSDLLCVKVDLVEKKALKPQIRERILQEVVEW